MYKYDKAFLDEKSKETGFIRDNLEKVYRLTDVLAYINANSVLSDCLVLKGGTAINLSVFNMPRLSVDIDLDFNSDCSRSEMLEAREKIRDVLLKYMSAEGYVLNASKGKNPHSLDSWVFYYQNSAGNRDNIKIEINYSMRCHILPIRKTTVNVDFIEAPFGVNAVAPQELFGSKIKALLERSAARDLYDIHNMLYFSIFDEQEQELLRKCIVFYHAVGSTGAFKETISFNNIDKLNFSKIRQTLLPVIRKSEKVDLEYLKTEIKSYLKTLMVLTGDEKDFLHKFSLGKYRPELLFNDASIIKRIENHPMAIWKIKQITDICR